METLREVVTMQENESGARSAFFMFYDAYQLVSLRAGEKAELPCVIRDSDCKLTLYKNCRNTNAIATSAARGILAHGKSPEMALGAIAGTSPEIHFLDTTTPDAVLTAAVSRTVTELRKSYRPEEIVLISCAPEGEGHSRLERSLKVNADTDDRWFNQVYPFTTYRKFKGLDAAVRAGCVRRRRPLQGDASNAVSTHALGRLPTNGQCVICHISYCYLYHRYICNSASYSALLPCI